MYFIEDISKGRDVLQGAIFQYSAPTYEHALAEAYYSSNTKQILGSIHDWADQILPERVRGHNLADVERLKFEPRPEDVEFVRCYHEACVIGKKLE